jgi:hypothetical protein
LASLTEAGLSEGVHRCVAVEQEGKIALAWVRPFDDGVTLVAAPRALHVMREAGDLSLDPHFTSTLGKIAAGLKMTR